MTETNKKGVSFLEKIEYGGGTMFTLGLGSYIVNLYFFFFLTDIAKVPMAIAATAVTALKLLKAITMAGTGILIDSTNFKSGKYRTWVLIGDVTMFFLSGLMFLKYDYSNPVVYVIILLIFQFINMLAYNVSWISGRALIGVMAVNTSDSVALAAAANIGGTACGIIYGIVSPIVLGLYAGSNNQYMFSSYTLAIVFLIGAAVMMKLTKKYELGLPDTDKGTKPVAKPQEKVTLKDMLSTLKGPGAWYCISCLLMNCGTGIQSVLLVYYTTYVLKNPLMASYSVTANSIAGFIGSLISPWICAKLSKKKVYFLGILLGSFTFASIYFIGSNGILYIAFCVLKSIFTAPAGTAMVAMANDIADYNAMKGHASAKAFVQSMMGLTVRVGGFISTAVASFGLVAIGYQPGTVPEAGVLNAIILMMAMVPAVGFLLSALTILPYKIDDKEIEAWKLAKANAK